LALVIDTSIGGGRLARESDILIARRGKLLTIVSDNGTEMTSPAMVSSAALPPAPEISYAFVSTASVAKAMRMRAGIATVIIRLTLGGE
jgi:hypothetical protein